MTSVSTDLLEMIRCPVTHTDLMEISDGQLAEFNRRIKAGAMINRIGQTVTSPIDGGLINQDATLLMPVRSGIVTLIADEAIIIDDA